MMRLCSGQPHTVIGRSASPIPQNENDLSSHINGRAAKHKPRNRPQRPQCLEHELMGTAFRGLVRNSASSGELVLRGGRLDLNLWDGILA